MDKLQELETERQELRVKQSALSSELARIKVQISDATGHKRATGEYADHDWFRRVNAKGHYTQEKLSGINRKLNELEYEIAKLRKQRMQEANRVRSEAHSALFVEESKKVLDTATYMAIWRSVEARLLQEGNAQ